MKKKVNTIKRSRLNLFILLLFIASIITVFLFILTDHIPAWSPELGLLFEVANNFAISFICTTVFYLFTVYFPEKAQNKRDIKKAKVEFKALNKNINLLNLFLLGNANQILGKADENLIVNQANIQDACKVLSDKNMWSNDSFYKLLEIQVNELTKQSELLLAKYEKVISEETETALQRFIDNTGFYCILDAKKYERKADSVLKHDVFSDYYLPAEKLSQIIDLMVKED